MSATLMRRQPAAENLPQRLVAALLGSMDAGVGERMDGHGRRARLLERPNHNGDCFDLLIQIRSQAAEQPHFITVAEGLRAGAYGSPTLDIGPDGHIVVIWEDSVALNVIARCFDAQNRPCGEAFVVNTSRESVCRLNPRVKVNSAGAFVVVWEHGWTQARARIFTAAGRSGGDELPLDSVGRI